MINISRFLLISTAFFVPIFVSNALLFPFTFSKTFLFTLLLMLASLFFCVEIFSNKTFKNEAAQKISLFIKNPLFISISIFFLIGVVTTFFATDKYLAFWGNLERGDGLAGLISLFLFLLLTLFSFEKKHWLWFFKASVISSFVLILKGFSDILGGEIMRIESHIGNPAFLAGYFLFSITSALIILKESKEKFWQYFAGIISILSVMGIFLTQTRGTLLGLFAGIFIVSLFFILRKESLRYKNVNVKKILTIFVSFGIVLSAVFVVTRNSDFWVKIPGISRIADISIEDDTTRSRLLVWQTSLDSINPNKELKEFFLGYGLENSIFGIDRYYNPEIYKYDSGYIDRSHNKFFDVFVMTGVIGLFAYLAIWFFFFKSILKNKDVGSAIILFFGVSFLVHLMFLFDQTPTSIALYSMFAFSLFYFSNNKTNEGISNKTENVVFGFLILIIVLHLFIFLKGVLPSYIQSKKYNRIISTKDIVLIDENIHKATGSFSPAQLDIRKELISFTQKVYASKDFSSLDEKRVENLFNTTIDLANDYMDKRPEDYRFLSAVSNLYFQKGVTLSDVESFKISEDYLRGVLNHVPNRPALTRGLIVNLTNQGRYEEASEIIEGFLENNYDIAEFYYDYGYIDFLKKDFDSAFVNFEKSFDMKSELFKKEGLSLNTQIYGTLLEFFYLKRDKQNFILVSERLKANDYHAADSLDLLVDQINKGFWPNINFK